jgi:hypothetical protein
MALINVVVPDIGDFKDVAVIELMVQPGDTVAVDQSLVTVESDKASMEIPCEPCWRGEVAEAWPWATRSAKAAVLLELEAAGAAAQGPAVAPVAAPAAAAVARCTCCSGCQPRRHLPQPGRRHGADHRAVTCWCWAAARVAIRRRSARPTWA